ncbi:MAG: WYL domain-containing protein [Acidobacteriota bacterium]
MKADRLLTTLLLLQANRRLTGRQLAERLEVSERTVHRDMEALSVAGVPVVALRGAQGGWQLDEDWRTQVPGMDDTELRALLMTQPRALGDPKLAAAAESALSKLLAAMPEAMRQRAASMRERLYVDPAGWRGAAEDIGQLPVVQEAVTRDRKLAFVYAGGSSAGAERVVDPLGLIAKGSTWYLYASTKRGMRTFRVSRITDARMLDEPCRRPPDFDIAKAWRASTESFERERGRYPAVLRLTPAAAERLKMWMVIEPQKADPTLWRAEFESEAQAVFISLGLGASAEVLEPDTLRERVSSEICKAARKLSR